MSGSHVISPQSHGYRPEVDGLRALAVVPVLGFHAGLPGFHGGFLGVDIFFVISGYLITGILLREIAAGRFSIWAFYERRARRILPALFTMITLCVPFALTLMSPADAKDFGQSVVATIGFASNFLFWIESGYFDGPADLKPLLHTWSLAVEEQYYLLFPFVLVACAKGGRLTIIATVSALMIGSLYCAQLVVESHPSAAFFLPISRFWEILIGAGCALVPASWLAGFRFGGVLAGSGLAAVFTSFLLFDEHVPSPGLLTLFPAAGVAMLLIYGRSDTAVGRLLSSRGLVGLGLISFSLYLLHQPLLAFYRLTLGEPTATVAIGVLAACVLLAIASFRFVETPFRTRRLLRSSNGFVAVMSGWGIALGSLGLWLHVSDGREAQFVGRLQPSEALLYAGWKEATAEPLEPNRDLQECTFLASRMDNEVSRRVAHCSKLVPSITLLIGDSHALDVFDALTSSNGHAPLIGIANPGCRLHGDVWRCAWERTLNAVSSADVPVGRIIYVQAGYRLLEGGSANGAVDALFGGTKVEYRAADKENVEKVLSELLKLQLASGVDVFWLGPRLEPHYGLNQLLRAGASGRCDPSSITLDLTLERIFADLDAELSNQAAATGIGYVSQQKLIAFDPATDISDCREVFWFDGDHWSDQGERHFGARLESLL